MIKIITCHHYRHDLTRLFYLGVERLREKYNIQVYAAITKGDEESVKIASDNFARWVEVPNTPLGKKWNEAYRLAWSETSNAPIMVMGDDDLLSADALDALVQMASEGKFVAGLKECAVVDTAGQSHKIWNYKDNLQLIGAGRVFQRPPELHLAKPTQVIKIGDYSSAVNNHVLIPSPSNDSGRNLIKPMSIRALWADGISSGLDRSSEANLALLGYAPSQFSDGRIHVVDFKSDNNLHQFANFKGEAKQSHIEWSWFLGLQEKAYLSRVFNFKFDE
jgi:hypothetical protein